MAETISQLRTSYRWSEAALRWVAPSGRFVADKAVRAGFKAFVLRMGDDIAALARQVADGTLSVAEWQRQTAQKVKAAHVAATALARGGFDALTPADYGRIGNRLRYQYGKLAGFAADVSARRMTPKAIEARANLYARGAWAVHEAETYRNWTRRAAAGVSVETRNVLGRAEHCDPKGGRPGCRAESARGWVPIGSLSLPGSRTCLANCFCSVKYRERKPTPAAS